MVQQQQQREVFLTPAELVARWRNRISVQTLNNWRNLGKGPKPTKVSNRVLYKVTDVEAYERSLNK